MVLPSIAPVMDVLVKGNPSCDLKRLEASLNPHQHIYEHAGSVMFR